MKIGTPTPSKKDYITTGVPKNISLLEEAYEISRNDVINLTDDQRYSIRSGWKNLQRHLDQIGVTTFMGYV